MNHARDFPYGITTGCDQYPEATEWCQQNIGLLWQPINNRSGEWCVFRRKKAGPGCYDWFFLNEKHAALFALRWSQYILHGVNYQGVNHA
jgi:hypothetical protein